MENFDNGENGPGSVPRDWEVLATPPYTWAVLNGPTPTGGFNGATGPLVDHTTGTANGFYVYTESSGGAVGDTTEFTSPPVVISSLENPSFEFWYHLFGDDIVSFEVEVIDEVGDSTTNVFTRNAPVQTLQNDPYQLQIISLADYGDTVRVVFRGIRGAVVTDGFLGDMAIDDVRFFDAPVELVVASPTELTESLEKGQTSMQTLTLTNVSDEEVTFDITLVDAEGGVGLGASIVTLSPGRASRTEMSKRTTPFAGVNIDPLSTSAITDGFAGLMTTEQYASGFEGFLLGDINGQDGWVGQFVNWVIDTSNPSEGSQHIRSLSDGFGQTLAFSPAVPIGSEDFSSMSARINIQGAGVTWELIPQSNTAALVNTRLRFNPDGSIDALVSDGLGGGVFQALSVTTPAGYFKVDIEVNRATSEYTISFDDEEVFSALGFAGDIEQLVLLSAMEIAGPTFDMDELQILDGEVERGVPFISLDPVAGVIGAGTSVDIQVTFDATQQEFGTYVTNIVASINGGADESVIVPATLSVVGDPSIFVDPTVVQAVVDFNKPETRIVTIENTGGNPLDFDLSVIGAEFGITTTELSEQLNGYATNDAILDNRVQVKLQQDNVQSSVIEDLDDPQPLFITIGEEILSQDFEGGVFPPAGWTVVDNEGTGVQWQFSADVGETNYSGVGEAATVSSDAFGAAEFDTELRTPIINIAGKTSISVTYNVNYQNFGGLDFLDLDISTDGGTSWTNLLSWNEDHGAFRATPGEQVNISLDDAIVGADEMMLRWRYYDPNTGDFDWYAQIDDVLITENTEVWLALDQTAGTVPVGETAEIELQFDPTVVNPGFYVAGIIVNSNAVNTPTVGVVVSMEELEPAEISVDPESLDQELVAGRSASQVVTISNSGESALDFDFEGNFPNVGTVPTTSAGGEPFARSGLKKDQDGQVDLFSIQAIKPLGVGSGFAIEPPVEFSDVLYSTNFEDFGPGDINLQQGWAGQFVNWVIDSANPGGNDQHIRSVSDGLGQTLAFTPDVGVGTADISSTSMLIDLGDAGVTWQIIPQSNVQGFLVTRLSFDPDDSVRVFVSDNGGEFQTIPIAKPDGYFEVKIEVNRTTNDFSVYFDNALVFTGNGFAGSIEQIVLLSLMEVPGPTIDIDNLQIVDGIIPELSLSVAPRAGNIAAGDSLNVTVTFDATNLDGGVYEEDLVINNNDPSNNPFLLPTTLTVIDPQIIAVSPDTLTESLPKKSMSTQMLTVSNVGVADLNFKINIDGNLVVPTGTSSSTDAVPSFRDWREDSRIMAKLAGDGEPITNDPNNTPVGRMGTVALLFEDFEDATFPPADWSVVDNEGTGVTWQFAADYGEGNYSGSGEAATTSSDAFGSAEFDTELITPEIQVDGQDGLVLEYLVNYQNFAASDFLDVDISTDGGLNWTNMLSWNEDHGSFFSMPAELVSIQLDTFLAGATSFQVRWHYYDPNSGDFDWYAQIDDVVIGVPWLSIDQTAGVVPGGGSLDIEVTFDASSLDVGDYMTNLIVCSDDLKNPEVTVPAFLTVVQPATIGVIPDTLSLTLFEGFDADTSFIVTNSGDVDLEYDVTTVPSFASVTVNSSGIVVPSGEETVGINISAETLLPGDYSENFLIESNDPHTPVAPVAINLTVLDFVVLDMELEAVCSDNPDEERMWKVHNPNTFEWDAFWFIIGSSQFDDITLQPGDNFFASSTLMDRPNTLKLRWLDGDDQSQETISESIETPCELLDLNLTSVCSNNPDLFRRWRVTNPNVFQVMATWEVVGTTQTSSLWVEEEGETFFYTETVPGSPNTTRITWIDADGVEQENVKASGGEMCDVDNSCNGDEIVAFNQGFRKNGKKVLNRRSKTNNALGAPEENDEYNFVSLGFGGSIDIKLGSIIVDQPGNDFKVIETSFNDVNKACETYPETADVYVSLDGIDYLFVGSTCKDGDFDIAASGLMEMQYIRIVDTSNPSLFGKNADGFDVDGVFCINNHFSGAVPVSFGMANTVPDEEDDEMVAFPNPFDEKIAVKMKVENEGKFVIRVHDNQGILVAERTAISSLGKIDAEISAVNLASGTYIVTVSSEDGSYRSSSLLVKQ
ncbi:MAG: choice-of-anchor J domain-containing protein [Cyclobacteriaceae bacterium]